MLATMNLEHAIALPVASAKNSQQLFDRISALGLEERHIVVFEPPHPNLIFLRAGLNGISRAQVVIESGAAQPWQLKHLEDEITQFHNPVWERDAILPRCGRWTIRYAMRKRSEGPEIREDQGG